MKEIWDKRYDTKEYQYGTEANEFFKQYIDRTSPGRALLPAEGEGRNAVYAASKGWTVDAFDYSRIAREKALRLAQSRNVKINYTVSDFFDFALKPDFYDLIGLVYAHVHKDNRRAFHQKFMNGLRENGVLLLEAFSTDQLVNGTGGPKNIDMLYTLKDLKEDFKSLNILKAEQIDTHLNAGNHHKGAGNIIRILAQKTGPGFVIK